MERLFAIIFYLPPKACSFSASKAGSRGERSSFHGVIPCSNTKSPITLEHTFQYLLEIQLWLNTTHHYFTTCTTRSTDPALHQIKTTVCGKLTIANHPLEFHAVWQTPFWRTVLLLSPLSAPALIFSSSGQDSDKELARYIPSPLVSCRCSTQWTE